mgnify:CR=1 FL=1
MNNRNKTTENSNGKIAQQTKLRPWLGVPDVRFIQISQAMFNSGRAVNRQPGYRPGDSLSISCQMRNAKR